ncbi:MAG: lysophospholipid acyltransferase family protein [Candidatus Omnitrophota bacterium]|nr:lysophospholipid acyltransferase family protein [Candidatus Omnitrophota bacterium]
MIYTVLRFISLILCRLFFRIEVYGKKNIPEKGGFILASNHSSYLDPIILGVFCPRKLNFMARHDLFLNRFFGLLLSQVGAFPVKRNSADRSALKEALKRLSCGKALVLFPQGRRSSGLSAESSDFLAGVGFLAAKTNLPVIPAFIKGTDKALPKGAKCIKPGRICVCFGRQINIERGLPYQEITQLIMARIRQLSC